MSVLGREKLLSMCHVHHEFDSLYFRSFPRKEGKVSNCRCVPFWADFTPSIVVIFINIIREELGVL
jgi:hypothetical protein